MGVFDQIVQIIGGNNSTKASVTSRGSKGAVGVEILDGSGNQITNFGGAALVNEAYDYIEVTSTNASGDPLVIQFRNGPSSTLVATLTLTYDANGNFKTVTKT